MPDCDRLRADAQAAEIFSEMARSRLLAAKDSLEVSAVRWNDAKTRLRAAIRPAEALDRSDVPGPGLAGRARQP